MPRHLILLAVLLLGALLPAAPAGAAQPAPDIPFPSSGSGGGPGQIITDGEWVAWSMTVQPNRFSRSVTLYAASLSERRAITVAEGLDFYSYAGPHQPGFALAGGRLIYVQRGPDTEGANLMLYDLASGGRRVVANGPSIAMPALGGGQATWWEFAGEPGALAGRLLALPIDRPEASPATLAAVPLSHDYLLRESYASERWIVWLRGSDDGSPEQRPCWELGYMGRAGGEPTWIDLGCTQNVSRPLPAVALDGDSLAYTLADGGLITLNLSAGERSASGPHRSYTLAADAGRVFWVVEDSYELWGYEPAADAAFPIGRSAGTDVGAGGGHIAWVAATEAGSVVRTRAVAAVLPTARRDRAEAGEAAYFPETGHSLRGAFADYWRRNGGLPVFGYPLSEEFVQSAAPGEPGYTVQYFERQRFEFHPENAGTPYEVLLGRLGAEDLLRQGRAPENEPRADPATPHYFAATGQAIAPEFWAYWRSNGLDLGDPGLSEREALALWGYPLTPAAVETLPDGSRRLVQWFERARFEYHPENPEPYKVLLGLLAVDRVNAFGWPR